MEDEEEDVLKAYPIKKYFTPYQYAHLSEEDRQRYAKMRQEYEVLSDLGMDVAIPAFMIKKSKYDIEEGTTRRQTRQCTAKDRKKDEAASKGNTVDNEVTVLTDSVSGNTSEKITPGNAEGVQVGNGNNIVFDTLNVGKGNSLTGPGLNSYKIVGFLFDPKSFTSVPSAQLEMDTRQLKKDSSEVGEEDGTLSSTGTKMEEPVRDVIATPALNLKKELAQLLHKEKEHGSSLQFGDPMESGRELTQHSKELGSNDQNEGKEATPSKDVHSDKAAQYEIEEFDESMEREDTQSSHGENEEKIHEDVSDSTEGEEIQSSTGTNEEKIHENDDGDDEESKDREEMQSSNGENEEEIHEDDEEREETQLYNKANEENNNNDDDDDVLEEEEEDNAVDGETAEQVVIVVVGEEDEEEVIGQVTVKEKKEKKPKSPLTGIKAEKARREMRIRLKKARLMQEVKRLKKLHEATPPPPPKPKAKYPCGVCGFVFKRSTHLRRHQMSKMGRDGLTCIVRKEKITEFTCDTCGEVFKRKYNLKRHNWNKHSKKDVHKTIGEALLPDKDSRQLNSTEFKCSKCGEVCISGSDLGLHIEKSHSTDEGNEDETKEKVSSLSDAVEDGNDITTFLKSPVNVKEFKCEKCGMVFNRNYNLKRHMLSHTNAKPFSCAVCGKAFNQSNHLVEHERTHTGEKPFKCSTCKLRFSRHRQLVWHQKIHSKEKQFKCDICDKAFLRSDYLLCHKRTHEKKKQILKCDVCDKDFVTASGLKSHKKTHLKKRVVKIRERKVYKCKICDKEYANALALGGHRKIHSKTQVMCDVCNEPFSHKVYLATHKRCHKVKLKCDVCSKEYEKEENLKAHKKRHEDREQKEKNKKSEKGGNAVNEIRRKRKRLKTDEKFS